MISSLLFDFGAIAFDFGARHRNSDALKHTIKHILVQTVLEVGSFVFDFGALVFDFGRMVPRTPSMHTTEATPLLSSAW